MPKLRAWLLRFAGLFGKERRDRELADEIESHLALHADEIERRQASRGEENAAQARREAAMHLGGVEALKETYRDRRSLPVLETFLQDTRYAARLLRKNPLFALVAIAILALGIGANVAIFSVVNAMLLRPLPYHQGERLAHFNWMFRTGARPSVSAAQFLFWNENSRSFDSMGAYDLFARGANLSTGSTPQFVQVLGATQGFFPTLATEPFLGRNFSADECRPGGPGAAILSYGLWQSRFGGDAAVIGRSITVDGKPAAVVGVLPRSFEFATEADLWQPLKLQFTPQDNSGNYLMIGRLKQGVALAQAQAEMPAIYATFKARYPKAGGQDRGMSVESYQGWLTGWVSTSLLVLFGAAALILLIAMVNVSSLLLAKSSSRARELAIRASLGAGRLRLLRQMTIESIILALLGGAAGLAVASLVLRGIIAASPRSLPSTPFSPFIGFTQQIGLNGIVIAFTAGVAILIGTIVGVIASMRATRVDVYETLKEGSQAVSASRSRHRAHSALVVAEIALSTVLLTGALLLIRSLDKLQHVTLGFNSDHLWAAEFSMPPAKYGSAKSMWLFEQQIMQQLQSHPEISSIAVTSTLPLEPVLNTYIYRPDQGSSNGVSEQYYGVSPSYFKTMGISLLNGRELMDADGAGSEPVVVINEEVARNFWKDANPVGQLLHMGEAHAPVRRIVGVVANVKQIELGEDPQPAVYVPIAQLPDEFASIPFLSAVVIRSPVPPELGAIQRVFSQADSTIAIAHYRSLDQVVSESVTPQKFETGALVAFASLALVLTAVGIYGVLAFLLGERTHEVGIRMALGAAPSQVLAMALKQGMAPVLLGAVIGLAGAAATTRLMASLLFGVTPTDPATFAAVIGILAAVAFAACYIPALRATRIDPLTALRHE